MGIRGSIETKLSKAIARTTKFNLTPRKNRTENNVFRRKRDNFYIYFFLIFINGDTVKFINTALPFSYCHCIVFEHRITHANDRRSVRRKFSGSFELCTPR